MPASRTLGQTFLSLRSRNYRLFFIGQTISNSGNWLTNVALTLLVLKLTHSGIAIGWLAACQYGPILFFAPWAGAVADRYDKRKLLLLTQSLEMAQSISLAVLAFLPRPPLEFIYPVAAAGGVFLAFDNPLRRSFVSEMVPRSDLPNAVVLYSTIVNISRIFGPALAGLLVVSLGYGWCFSIDAASYAAVLACLVMMRPAELIRQPHRERTRGSGSVMEGIRYVLVTPVLWITFAMLAAINLLAYNFNVSLPLFVEYALHGSDSAFTLLYSVFSCGAVVSALIVAHRQLVGIRNILFGAAALGLTMLLLSLAPYVIIAAPAVFLVGMASILYTTPTTAIIQIESRPEIQGRLIALQTVLLGGGPAIGGPILGWVSDHSGPRSLMVLGGVVALLASMCGYLAARRFAAQELNDTKRGRINAA